MKAPEEIVVPIAEAVERAGGDMTDVEDLVEVWVRLCADRYGRVDRMRYENEQRRQDDMARRGGQS